MSSEWSHTFKTTLSLDRLQSLIAKACRAPFTMAVEGHDPTLLPAVTIIEAAFATVEDRDRVRIVLRQLEKEMIAASKIAPRRPPESTAQTRARAGAADSATSRPPPGYAQTVRGS